MAYGIGFDPEIDDIDLMDVKIYSAQTF